MSWTQHFAAAAGITERAKQLYGDQAFREEMTAVFATDAAGSLLVRSLDRAWAQIDDLPARVRRIEQSLADGR